MRVATSSPVLPAFFLAPNTQAFSKGGGGGGGGGAEAAELDAPKEQLFGDKIDMVRFDAPCRARALSAR